MTLQGENQINLNLAKHLHNVFPFELEIRIGWDKEGTDALRLRLDAESADLPVLVHLGMRSGAHSSQEWFIRDETIIILWIAALLDEDVDLLSLQLLSEGEEDVLQLPQHHGSVLLFVVQLQTLNKVLEGPGVLGLLHLGVDWVELFKLDELLPLLLCPTKFINHLEGRVEVETPEAVSQVEHIHARLTLEVIDVKGELSSLYVLVVKIVSHV